ncbi:hypothetical protein NHH82_16355 [Oxalobacteraceae bacterium OTU3REALA1]|nr:hypothetical protein NHH82_16355 [Oxalobacteraceae bacterium OTU3REALA1]
MSNYNKVQFISWELYTGPFSVDERPGAGWYCGLLNPALDKRLDALGQCWDIEARVAFTADAIAKAKAREKIDGEDKSALKVFMAPEFLYRGAGGAYLHDLIGGWAGGAPKDFQLPPPYNGPWAGLFDRLRALVAKDDYQDWVFVFGTALSASFPTAKAANGKYLLDPGAMGEIYNSALIQRGGAANGASQYISRKHYISPIDFVNRLGAAIQHRPGNVRPFLPRAVNPADVLGATEGGAVFRLAGVNDGNGKPIDFGIEICLDHALSGNSANQFGRIRTAGQYVKLQLVPSGGLELTDASIRLQPGGAATPHSYAFNCDGLYALDDGPSGCHTQVWNGANGASPVPAANKLVEASGGQAVAGTTLLDVAAELTVRDHPVRADMLWHDGDEAKGAGKVRVMKPLAL